MEQIAELNVFDDKLITQFDKQGTSKVGFWDIRAAVKSGTTLNFTDQKSKEISSFDIIECGIRSFYNGGWGFCVVKNLTRASLIDGFSTSIQLAKNSESLLKNKYNLSERSEFKDSFRIKSKKKIDDIDIEQKIENVKQHERIANDYSEKVKNTITAYLDGHSQSLYIDSIGSRVYQDSEVVRLLSVVYAQENGIIQHAVNSVGGVGGFEIIETDKAQNLSLESAKQAVELLNASSPKGGKFTVIMDPKLSGTFIHEAFGHACEADLVLNKNSILEGKIGEIVANESVSVIDDPRFGQGKRFNLPYDLFGSYYIDDEGVPSQKTVIIEKGVLKSFLHTLETSSRMGVAPNGHGRADSSGSIPQVRMGFTYMEPGDWKLEELIKETKTGILCEDFQYGYTDPTTGNFQFKCKVSYKIENGIKGEMMRDVALSGMTLEVLQRISAIGDEKTFSYSDGICGKGGQGVRVCDGGPYVRIEDLTVGGLN